MQEPGCIRLHSCSHNGVCTWQFVCLRLHDVCGREPVCARRAGSHSRVCMEGRAQAPPCRLGSSSLRRPTGRGPCAQSSSQSCSPGAGWAWADPRPQALPFSCFLPEDPPGGGQATGAMVETINWKRQLIPKGKHFQIRYYSLGLKNGTLPRGKTVY